MKFVDNDGDDDGDDGFTYFVSLGRKFTLWFLSLFSLF